MTKNTNRCPSRDAARDQIVRQTLRGRLPQRPAREGVLDILSLLAKVCLGKHSLVDGKHNPQVGRYLSDPGPADARPPSPSSSSSSSSSSAASSEGRVSAPARSAARTTWPATRSRTGVRLVAASRQKLTPRAPPLHASLAFPRETDANDTALTPSETRAASLFWEFFLLFFFFFKFVFSSSSLYEGLRVSLLVCGDAGWFGYVYVASATCQRKSSFSAGAESASSVSASLESETATYSSSEPPPSRATTSHSGQPTTLIAGCAVRGAYAKHLPRWHAANAEIPRSHSLETCWIATPDSRESTHSPFAHSANACLCAF